MIVIITFGLSTSVLAPPTHARFTHLGIQLDEVTFRLFLGVIKSKVSVDLIVQHGSFLKQGRLWTFAFALETHE